jgi:hypothetical protein
MNCAIHNDVPAVAYCRTCGKALCASCKRDVRGVIFCEECIANRIGDTIPASAPVAPGAQAWAPPDTGPSTALATLLGFIPGVGAMYNGQFMKALVHVIIFASLIWATDRVGFFGIFIPFFVFYMVFDAYKTARARQLGEPLPDPFGMERLWGGDVTPSAPPSGAVSSPANATVPNPNAVAADVGEPHPSEFHNAPVGAIILIAIGGLFLLDNIGLFDFHWFHRLWPVILIVIGVWMWTRRQAGARP